MNKQKDKNIHEQDSEIEEDNSDFELSQKVQKKQLEVEELSKKMRYMELDFKKREIEMNAVLANEKQRVEELQDILQKKLAGMKENKEADELQNRLTIVEDELFEKQQIAHEMLRSLTEMENENIYLKSEVERLRCSSPSLKPNQDIDVDKILNTCMELQKHNEELQLEVEQIKRGAVDTIVEKEKVIIDLQEQIDIISQNMKHMDDDHMAQDNNQYLQEEIENIRNEYEQRIQYLEERCQELSQRLEQDQLQYEEQLLNQEQQITERVLENMQQHIDSAKSVEADLLHQLQITEEKLRNQDKYIADSQKLLQSTREEFKKERESSEQKIRNLAKQADQYEEVNRQFKQLSKEFEDYRKLSEREINDKSTALEKLSVKRDELMKMQVNLDSENKRLKENLENSKQSIRNLQDQNDQLQEQIEETQRDVHYKMKELAEKYEKEKYMLLEDLKLQNDVQRKTSIHSNSGNRASVHEQKLQNTPQQIRKESVNSQPVSVQGASPNMIEVEKSENHVQQVKFDQQEAHANNFDSISKKSSDRKSIGSMPRTSNPNQTLLGLEFGDEDFSIEEEKTDNIYKEDSVTGDDVSSLVVEGKISDAGSMIDNAYSQFSVGEFTDSKLDPVMMQRKKESFNIVESASNPLLPQRTNTNSTRNQFKKQFMFPQQQNQTNPSPIKDTLTYDQIARGYNIENTNVQDLVNENIEIKLRNQKLECSINGLEVTIEKLQNEAKQTLKQLQEIRKEKVLTNKEAELIDELNSFKAHTHRVETQFVTQKLQLTEELHFYREEVRVLEKTANDNREQLLKLSQDKDYFQQKYTKLKSILKQRRTGGSVGGDNLFPDNYEIGIQQSQKKKTFWIFK